MHVARWFSITARALLARLSNLGVESLLTLQTSCIPLLNLRRFEVISKIQKKGNQSRGSPAIR